MIGSHTLPIVSIPNGSVLYVAGTIDEYKQLKASFKSLGANIRIRHAGELVENYILPKADTNNYQTHAGNKLQAALNAWKEMNPEIQTQRLEQQGITPSHSYIVSIGKGFHFNTPHIEQHDTFSHLKHRPALFPGPESENIIRSCGGPQEFFYKATEALGDDRSLTVQSTLLLQSLDSWMAQKIPAEYTATGTLDSLHSPAEAPDGHIFSGFVTPPGIFPDTIEESCAALARNTNLQLGITPPIDYEPVFTAGIIGDNDTHLGKIQYEQLQKRYAQEGFGVDAFTKNIQKAGDILEKFSRHADGFVLAFDPERAKEDFWENLYIFSSLISGKKTNAPYSAGKPIVLINPDEESGKRPFDPLIEVIEDLHKVGGIKQSPASFYQTCSTPDEALSLLQKERTEYRRAPIPEYATGSRNTVEGTPLSTDFNVAIFCAAGNTNSLFTEDARNLAKGLFEDNFGVISGAGIFSSMGAITETGEAMRDTHHAQHAGTSCHYLMGNDGGARADQMTEFLLAQDIYERMEFCFNRADAFILAPGGIGSVQEMALLGLLKKRAVEADTNAVPDLYAIQKTRGKEIVILNTQICNDGEKRGFYDKLLEVIPEKDFEKLGIHIVETVDQAIAKTKEFRETRMPLRDGVEAPSSARHRTA